MFYDKDGQVISPEEYMRLKEDLAYCRIAADTLPNGIFVSTVWLGDDYEPIQRKPHIFETMAFAPVGASGESDLALARYETEEGARMGHKQMVARMRRRKKVICTP